MTIAEMFGSPSAAHLTVNRTQLGRALDLMAHHAQRGGDSNPGYHAASDQAAEAMEPMYQHEMRHRHRDRNPYGIEAMSPYPPAPDQTPRQLELNNELVGQHERQIPGTDYTTTVIPYGQYGRSHVAYATHVDSHKPVAELKWNPHGGEIEWAHTEDEHQRQGLASALVAHGREAGAMTPGMTSPLPSPELSHKGLALSRGMLSRVQWSG